MPLKLKQQVLNTLQRFERQTKPIATEYRLLLAAIKRRINVPMASAVPKPVPSHLADARATGLYVLKQRPQLTQPDVEEIIASCNDLRKPSKDKWRELTGDRFAIVPSTIRQIAWRLTGQQFSFDERAYSFLIEALDSPEVVVCAAAARLLQQSNNISPELAEQTAQRILRLLLNDELSHRWLEFPDYGKVWRLDDILFETLERLAG